MPSPASLPFDPIALSWTPDMHHSDVSVARAPYGLAFEVEDLLLLRSWAGQRRLQLTILLDRIVDGAEFEEVLVVAPAGSDRRTLTFWRTQDGVFAQPPGGRPHGFATMHDLLEHVRPARPKRSVWLQRLGLAG
jgi:hypothetical protein